MIQGQRWVPADGLHGPVEVARSAVGPAQLEAPATSANDWRLAYPDPATRANALDHVVVLFENRSLDNVLGRLYGPGDGKTFEGVIGKELSNPIPGWAEHGADRKVVPYGVAAGMDSPNPDSGEEWYHVNTPAGRSMIVTPRCSVRVWSVITYVGQPWPR